MNDKRLHGTLRIGESNHSSTITEEKAREIKFCTLTFSTVKEKAAYFGVSISIINQIKFGCSWNWLGKTNKK